MNAEEIKENSKKQFKRDLFAKSFFLILILSMMVIILLILIDQKNSTLNEANRYLVSFFLWIFELGIFLIAVLIIFQINLMYQYGSEKKSAKLLKKIFTSQSFKEIVSLELKIHFLRRYYLLEEKTILYLEKMLETYQRYLNDALAQIDFEFWLFAQNNALKSIGSFKEKSIKKIMLQREKVKEAIKKMEVFQFTNWNGWREVLQSDSIVKLNLEFNDITQ